MPAPVVPPQMDPWCCVPVAAWRGDSGLWVVTHQLPGLRDRSRFPAGAPPGTARSGVRGFLRRAGPPRCAASGGRTGWRRRPEREVGMSGPGKLGASPPGQPPSPCPGHAPLGPARGRLPIPRVRSAGVKRASLASPSSRRGGRGPGAGEFHPLHPALAASVSARDFVLPGRSAERSPPTPCRAAARLPSKRARGSLPETSPFRGRRRSLCAGLSPPGESPLRAALSGLSSGPLFGAALLCRTALGAEVHAGHCPAWLARSDAATGGATRLRAAASPPRPLPPGRAGPLPSLVSDRRCGLWAGPPTRGLQRSHPGRADPGSGC